MRADDNALADPKTESRVEAVMSRVSGEDSEHVVSPTVAFSQVSYDVLYIYS